MIRIFALSLLTFDVVYLFICLKELLSGADIFFLEMLV